jgi:mannose-1-phosphate guanylyltransferase
VEHYYALIMAGGGGTRLWPLSRKEMPKQLIPLTEEHSLFRTSVLRLAPLFTPERIFVVTGRQYIDMLREETPEIPAENFIIEPYGKNTASAVGLALTVIHHRDPEATIAVLTADHHIGKKETFRNVLCAAHDLALRGHVVTLGISPTYPATGFGYIHQGETLDQDSAFSCYTALGFREKPNIVTATELLASGNYSWNSGMFIWKTETAMAEFQQQQPDMYEQMVALSAVVDTPEFETRLAQIWDAFPRLSIDVAIMEHAQNMVVFAVDIGWSDVGSWDSLFEVLKMDKFGNCFKGTGPDNIILDTRDSLIFSNRLVVTIGLEDIVVVDSDDALLVCRRGRSQDVREVVNHLRATGQERFL